MRLNAVLMMMLLVASTMSGCTGQDSDEGADNSDLQAEISNLTADLDAANERALALDATLSEAASQLSIAEDSIVEMQGQLENADELRESLESQLSDAQEQLNSTDPSDQSTIDSLQREISNLTAELANSNYQVSSLEEMMTLKNEEIQSLEATIAALQSTMGALSYEVRERIASCPQDNPGMEMAIGYDDGSGAASPGDGRVNYDEIQFTVGECPGDSGMVSDLQAGDARDWGPSLFVEMGGNFYFAGNDGVHGWELWRSDGSVGGTYMVKDLREGSGGSLTTWDWGSPFGIHYPEIVAGNSKIFFTGFDGEPGTESCACLIVSDGTADGTYQIDQWNDWGAAYGGENGWRPGFSGASQLLVLPSSGFVPDRVIYSNMEAKGGQNDDSHPPTGEELWISDGTETGTYLLANIVPEDESWQYSGVTYCCGDFQGSAPRDLIKKGNTIWFTAQTDSYGRELYRYGMNVGGGLFLVKDINEGTSGSNPMHLTSAGPGVFLSADNGTLGQELFYSLGNTFTTDVVKDINPGSNSSNPRELTKFGSSLFFTADDGQNGRELWISDSTAEGTFMVKDINNNGSSSPNWLRVMDDTLFFMAYTEDYGRELWKSDGTAEGTVMVKDINPGNNSSFYWTESFFLLELSLVHDGALYFSADDGGEYGVEVWRSDGTANGTELVVDATPGNESSWPARYTSIGGKLYFTSYSEDRGRQLWFYWDNPGPVIG